MNVSAHEERNIEVMHIHTYKYNFYQLQGIVKSSSAYFNFANNQNENTTI